MIRPLVCCAVQGRSKPAPAIQKGLQMRKTWMVIWLALGVYSVIAAVGGGGAFSALCAMLSGFMVARNMADIAAQPDAVSSDEE